MENQLSSCKVFSEGSKTVFTVLRLTALTSTAEHNTHTVQQYRRKPPSQQNRDKKRAEEHSKRFSQHKERQTDVQKNQQASDLLILASNCLTKTQSPVHMNTNIETYTTHHSTKFLPPSLDSHEAATGVFARATFRDNDKNTQLHSGEYQNSADAANCVDTQAPAFPSVDPRSGVPTEGEPTDSSAQNTRKSCHDPDREKST